jgi:predicted transcriptional regulator
MKKLMPQEIEVWYLIPALRREFAKIFIKDYKLSQKKSAELLGITEAAISQYLNSKRGNEIKFSKKEMDIIKESAKKIVKDKENIMRVLYELCIQFRESKVICNLHKNQDKSIPKNCDVCFMRD